MAHGGWRSLAHRRYDRFSLREVLRLPDAMLAVGADESPAPLVLVAPSAGASSTAAPSQTAAAPLPLTPANCVGRRVLCPRAMWPRRACRMHGGAGWEAVVQKKRTVRGSCEVFLDFVADAGQSADRSMWLKLTALVPIR